MNDGMYPSDAEKYRRRSAAAGRKAAEFLIEGESIPMAEIAERLGLTVETARKRHQRECKKDGPVTLAGMAKA